MGAEKLYVLRRSEVAQEAWVSYRVCRDARSGGVGGYAARPVMLIRDAQCLVFTSDGRS